MDIIKQQTELKRFILYQMNLGLDAYGINISEDARDMLILRTSRNIDTMFLTGLPQAAKGKSNEV